MNKTHGKSNLRIIIYAETGLLAGDLAAWLSGRYQVERVTSWPGVHLALSHSCQALIVIDGQQAATSVELSHAVDECRPCGGKVLLLGAKPEAVAPNLHEHIRFLEALPQPREFLQALQAIGGKSMEAEG